MRQGGTDDGAQVLIAGRVSNSTRDDAAGIA
jgi:hypothetical protein